MSKMKANAILNNWRGFKPLEPKIPHHRELQEVLRSRLGTRRQPYHDHLSDGLSFVRILDMLTIIVIVIFKMAAKKQLG